MNLEVGMILDGYCNGRFGRTYGHKTIVGFGDDWIVVRDEDGDLMVAKFDSHEEMIELVKKWTGLS